jgi:hypothetical protein
MAFLLPFIPLIVGTGVGVGAGLLLGGSGAKSTAKQLIENSIKGSVKAIMEAEVDASITVSCSNNQISNNASKCDISFASQVCEAVGLSNVTNTTEFSADVAQKVMNTIKAATEAAASGFTLGKNESTSDMTTKNSVDMSMDVTQSFKTTCTRNVTAINLQSVTDCSESAHRFAPQDVSASAIGDCVVNSVARFTAAQDLTNKLDLMSKATSTGIDFTAIFLILVAIALIMFMGRGAAKQMYATAYGEPGYGQQVMSPADQEASKWRLRAGMVLAALLVTSVVFWWPGLPYVSGGYYLNLFPYSYAGSASDPVFDPENPGAGVPLCQSGKNLNRDTFINTFMWFDPLCLSTPGVACTGAVKEKHYASCGIFADEFGCDDPLFLEERARYTKMMGLCSDVKLLGARPKYCDSVHLAADLFPPDSDTYKGCQKCIEGPAQNLWVRDGGFCSAISLRDYMRPPGEACDPGDPHCKDSENMLRQSSPDDCMDTAYQRTKRTHSKSLVLCDAVEANATVTTASNGGEKPLFLAQCPGTDVAFAKQYLTKCNPSTGECGYTAKAANPAVGASCRNDLLGCCSENEQGVLICNDKDLEKDFAIYNHWNDVCKTRWDQQNKLNPYAWVATLIVYFMMLAGMGYMLMSAPTGMQQAFARGGWGAGVPPAQQSNSLKIAFFFTMLILAAAAGPPFGFAGMLDGGAEFPFSVYGEGVAEGLGFSDTTTFYYFAVAVAGLCLVAAAGAGGWALYNWSHTGPGGQWVQTAQPHTGGGKWKPAAYGGVQTAQPHVVMGEIQ